MEQERRLILKMVQIALFIASCFVGTSIAIPLGLSKVHLGNFFCILAGLLCGPFVGGLSGSIGMGVHDIMMGYAYTTYVRTFLLKFLMGFAVGYLYRLLLKKKANGNLFLLLGAIALGAIFSYCLTIYFTDYNEKYSLLLLILSSVLFAFYLLGLCFFKKLDHPLKLLLFSLLVALSVNVLGEFFLRYLINLSLGMEASKAMLVSYAKLPAALLTSILTVLGILLFFYPLYYATRPFNSLDDLGPYFKKGGREEEESKEGR